MNDGLMLQISASTEQAVSRLKNVTQSFKSLQTQTTKNTNGMGSFQKSAKKLNDQFANMSKDANRSANSLGKMAKSMNALNGAINIASIYALATALAKSVQSAMDMIETTNLFTVSLGNMSEKAEETVQALSKVYGLDATNLRNSIGTYALLARSMGMNSTQAETLSSGIAQLALDLSSLTNVPINQVMADLKSGLIGQSETVYKYGLDVTEAGVKQEALAQGITKSVRNMSQGEKMALRYSVMLKQSSIAQGDFASTIDQPANQLKILGERFTTLSRTIGSIFIPMLQIVLPYLNAVVQVLINMAQALAGLLGFEMPTVENGGGLGNITDDADGTSDALDKANESAKKFQKTISKFDSINIIQEPTKGKDKDDNLGSILGGMDLKDYDISLSPITKVDELVKSFTQTLENLKAKLEPTTTAFKNLWDNGLDKLSTFSFGVLQSFYDNFLVPVGNWSLGTGLPTLLNTTNEMLMNTNFEPLSTAFDNLFTSLAPFAENVGNGLLWFYDNVMLNLAKWSIEDLLPSFLGLLESSLGFLNTTIEVFKPLGVWLFDNFLKPIASWTGGTIVTIIGGITTALDGITTWISENESLVRTMTTTIGAFFVAWKVTELMAFISMSGGVVGAFKSITSAIALCTTAKLADKLETIAITALYAKDFVMSVISGTTAIIKQIAQWTIATGLKIADNVATIALTVSTVALGVASTVAAGATSALNTALAILTSPITLVIGAIVALIAGIVALVKNWDTVKSTAVKTWSKIVSTWTVASSWFSAKVVSPIAKFFSTLWTNIVSMAKTTWTNVKSAFNDVGDFFGGMWTTIKSKFVDIGTSIGSAVGGAFKAVMNNVLTTIENTVNGFINLINGAIKIINLIPGVKLPDINTVNLPRLAKGGIVDSATPAIIGEAGKEAVMPLENNTGWITDLAQQVYERGGGGSNMTESMLFNAVKRALKESGDGEIVIYVDSEAIARASNRGNKFLKTRGFNSPSVELI